MMWGVFFLENGGFCELLDENEATHRSQRSPLVDTCFLLINTNYILSLDNLDSGHRFYLSRPRLA